MDYKADLMAILNGIKDKIRETDYKKYKEKILNSLKKKEEKYKYLQKFYKKELWICLTL